MLIRLSRVVITIGLLLTLGSVSEAQTPGASIADTPTFEVAAGYQFLHVPDQNFPFGLNLDGVRHWGNLGLAAEAGWAHGSNDDAGFDISINMWNFGAGPRWTGFRSGRNWWPYAQVLGGLAVAHASAEIAGVDESETENAFLLQPGVGATFIGGDGWGVFGQVDYRRTFFEEEDDSDSSINNGFRIFIGARLILD
jgi:hypothetical protein